MDIELLINIVYIAFSILSLIAMWMIYTKANRPGWAVIIPIYNLVVMLQIVKKSMWWILLLFIPIVNIVIMIMLNFALAKAYSKGAGFGLGLTFLPFIFIPILGFGSSKYILGNVKSSAAPASEPL